MSLASEARFDIVDAGLERRYLLLQLVQVASENLPPTGLVAEARLDPAQCLGDRVIFLFEAFEPSIILVEVAEHLASQLANLAVDLVEAAVDLHKLPPEKLDQLLVLGWGHGVMIIPRADVTQG